MIRGHYERIVAVCAFFFTFVNIGIPSTSFSVFQPFIVERVGDTGGSLILFTRALASLIVMFAVDRYYARLDVRFGITVATALTAAGFVVYGFADTLPAFLVGAALGGIGYGLGGMVAATIIINRWFISNVSTAVGFAATGSGAASVLMPLLALRLIAHGSLSLAFFAEAAIAGIVALCLFLLVRNRPADIGAEPYESASHHTDDESESKGRTRGVSPSRRMRLLLVAGMFLLGSVAYGGTSYLTVLMTSEGFDPIFAGFMFTIMGAFLTVSKFVTGFLFDRIGTQRGSELLFGVLIASLVLCCLMPMSSAWIAGAAAVTYGIGISLATVGISVWSLELTDPMHLAQTVKRFQLAYATGGVVFNILPGILMETTGTYVISYAMMLVFAVVTGAIVRAGYMNVGKV